MEKLSCKVNLYYLLAILNSTYASHLLDIQRSGDYHIYPEHIRNLPIPIAPTKEMEELTALAKKQLELHAKMSVAKLASEKDSLQTLITTIDAKIDEIVYALYGVDKR